MNTIFSILFCIQVDNYKTVVEDNQKDLDADDHLPQIQTSYKTPSSYGTLNSDEKISLGDETITRVSSAGYLRVNHASERQ